MLARFLTLLDDMDDEDRDDMLDTLAIIALIVIGGAVIYAGARLALLP
ncbi:hypothetical protein V8J36_05440 [Frigidibacter sp. MR17.14]